MNLLRGTAKIMKNMNQNFRQGVEQLGERSMLQSLITLGLFFLRIVKAECPIPLDLGQSVILSSEAVLRNEFSEGSQITLECDNGYVRREGSQTITCMSGNWTEVKLICKRKDCGPPKVIPHLTFIYKNGENATYFRDRITAVCEQGFQLVGSSHWQCLNHGWKGKSTCLEIVCGEAQLDTLPVLENGRIVNAPLHEEHIKMGDSIQYSCNDDYHLTGNDTITCTENGYSELPKCERQRFQHPSKTPMKEQIESSVSVSTGAIIGALAVSVLVIVFGLIWHYAKNKGSYETQEERHKMGDVTERKLDSLQGYLVAV
ncbi:sushi, von Willebrand factor type A, EGF and pentraxin domain-containing protein 1-like isoform X2 [Sardina pilchardus]|uniref:sushi, von Willebrand factor type A, EGF and pentraxin domain-containing protein 1-like isoform X2 n=1 Tax=Sardina pilchardus TaxID=27697 RepID=UPI002E102552